MTNDVLEALRKGAVRLIEKNVRVLGRECRSPQRTRRAFPGVNDFIRMRIHVVKRSHKKPFMDEIVCFGISANHFVKKEKKHIVKQNARYISGEYGRVDFV